ncbi:uncharacterized protein LOC119110270 isoform X1 [Pollicipes pollicipes]|uniref:uncharacterized protein LOC119110270 isoform X1 n=1 Tax=Pollicipes pollicipes TaxID=41117 RepID=UPI001884E61B|nr:uncharacterized protein LOC119110270 isoform X1 [Pollicipes pollicipes]
MASLKHYGSTSSLGSKGSLSNLLKDGVDNLEGSITKKWLSWMLRRRMQTSVGRVKTAEANSFVDATVEQTRELVKNEGHEVMKVPNDQTVFEEKFLFFRVSASVTFQSSYLKGLTSLERIGDAVLELDGDWLTLQTALAADQIECFSTCAARFMDIGPTFELTALVDAVTLKVKARINTATTQVIICTCELVHVGDMVVSESGEVLRVVPGGQADDGQDAAAFPLTSLLAVVSELFVSRCRDNIIQLFECEAQRQLLTALQQADLERLVGMYGRSYFRSAAEPEPKLPAP